VRGGRVAVTSVRVNVKPVFDPIAPPLPPPPQAPSRKPATPASANSGAIRPNRRRLVRRPDIALLAPSLSHPLRVRLDDRRLGLAPFAAIGILLGHLLTADSAAAARRAYARDTLRV